MSRSRRRAWRTVLVLAGTGSRRRAYLPLVVDLPARVRLFDPALGGAAYTCKDLREGGGDSWRLANGRAAESLAGKDRYEFEKFFASRTVLTLSESIGRFIATRQRIPAESPELAKGFRETASRHPRTSDS